MSPCCSQQPHQPIAGDRLVVDDQRPDPGHATSASSVRSGRWRADRKRNADRDPESAFREVREREGVSGAIQVGEPRPCVAQPDAVVDRDQPIRRQAVAAVADLELEAAVRPSGAGFRSGPGRARGAMPWRTAFSTSGCSSRCGTRASSVSGSTSIETLRRSRKRVCSIARYDCRISSSCLTLTSCALRPETHAQQLAEAVDHQVRRLDVASHQAGDGVQRVEQEVRLQLPLQRLELRLRQTRLQPFGVERAFARFAPVRDGVAEANEEEVGRQQPVELRQILPLYVAPPVHVHDAAAVLKQHRAGTQHRRRVHQREQQRGRDVESERHRPRRVSETVAPRHRHHHRREQRRHIPVREVEHQQLAITSDDIHVLSVNICSRHDWIVDESASTVATVNSSMVPIGCGWLPDAVRAMRPL